MEPDGDGVKRYLVELLTAITQLPAPIQQQWQFDLYIYGDIVSLQDYLSELRIDVAQRNYGLLWYEKYLLGFKSMMQQVLPRSIYNALAPIYRHMPFRWLLQRIKKTGKVIRRLITPLRKDSRFDKYDLIHLPLPQHEDSFKGLSIPVVATLHDLTDVLFPEWHQRRNLRLAKRGMRFLLDAEAYFIAVSESTRQDLLTYYAVPEDHVDVVYEAANPNHFHPHATEVQRQTVRKKYGIGTAPYLLTLSTIEPRKNLLRTVRAFQEMKRNHTELAVKLVIAGKYGWKSREVYKGVDFTDDAILFTGFVAEADLPVLYAEAQALCYVSLYEGFGLPPVEAMLCGTPVIFGNRSSLPEVVGEAGIGVDPEDTTAIAQAMYQMVSTNNSESGQVEAAVNQGRSFSWSQCARDTLAVYEKAISQAKN